MNGINGNSKLYKRYKDVYDEFAKTEEYKKSLDFSWRSKFPLFMIIAVISVLLMPVLGNFSLILGGVFFFLGLIGLLSNKNLQQIKNEKLFLVFLNKLYPNYKHDKKNGISENDYVFKNCFSGYDYFVSSDKLECLIDDVYPLTFSRFSLILTDDGGSTTTFHGFTGFVELNNNKIEKNLLIAISPIFLQSNIKFENETFNTRFNVVCEDEIQAYKFLTPDVLQEFCDSRLFSSFDYMITKDRIYFRTSFYNEFKEYETEEETIQNLKVLDFTFIRINESLKKIIKNLER